MIDPDPTSSSISQRLPARNDGCLWILAACSLLLSLFLIYDCITSFRTLLPEFLFTLVPQWFVRQFVEDLPRWIELALVVSLPGVAMGTTLLTCAFALDRVRAAPRAQVARVYRRLAGAAACGIMVDAFCIFSLWRAYFRGL